MLNEGFRTRRRELQAMVAVAERGRNSASDKTSYLQLRARTTERLSVVGTGVSEDPVEPKVWDALEMPDVAYYELEVVIEGGRSDL